MCLHDVIDHDSVFQIVKTSKLHHKCNILFFISAARFYSAANSKHLKPLIPGFKGLLWTCHAICKARNQLYTQVRAEYILRSHYRENGWEPCGRLKRQPRRAFK